VKIAVSTMVSSLPSIISVIVIASVVLSVFAVFGLHIFKGSFYRCVNDEAAAMRRAQIGKEHSSLDAINDK